MPKLTEPQVVTEGVLSADGTHRVIEKIAGNFRISARPRVATEKILTVRDVVLFGAVTNDDAIQIKESDVPGSPGAKWGYEQINLSNVQVFDWTPADYADWRKDALGRPQKPHVDFLQLILGKSRARVYGQDVFFRDSNIDTLIVDGNAEEVRFKRLRLVDTHQGLKVTQHKDAVIEHLVLEDVPWNTPLYLLGTPGGVRKVTLVNSPGVKVAANDSKAEVVMRPSPLQEALGQIAAQGAAIAEKDAEIEALKKRLGTITAWMRAMPQ